MTPGIEELEEQQRAAGRVEYEREKLVKLEGIAARAHGDLRMAKIEAEVAASNVETKQAMVDFADAAVAFQRGQIEKAADGAVPSEPEPAPTDASPPQGDPPGAGTPPTSPASSRPDDAPPSAPPPSSTSLAEAPTPKTKARAAWNVDRAREVLRGKGVVKVADVVPAVGSIDASRMALKKLVDAGEAQRTGQRGGTRYHWQERIGGIGEDASGSTRTDDDASGSTRTPPADPPLGTEKKTPIDQGPPKPDSGGRRPQKDDDDEWLGERLGKGRGRTSQSQDQAPSFQGLMHQRLIIKPMSVGQMFEEWPERSEQEIRQALGENMKSGDVTQKHKGGETRYHGRS